MKIDWLTGLVVIPDGKLINNVHGDIGPTYSDYIILEFENGNLRKELNMDHIEYENFKEKQFQLFKISDEYKKLKDELMEKTPTSEDFLDTFLREYLIDYTSKVLTD